MIKIRVILKIVILLVVGASRVQAQFFTDNFTSPSSPTPITGNGGGTADTNWPTAYLAGTPSAAMIGGGKLSYTNSTGGFSGLGLVSPLSIDYDYFKGAVTYAISGLSFSGAPESGSSNWVEIHIGPAVSTVDNQNCNGGPGSTLFVLRLCANGQLMGGSMENNGNSSSGFNGALDVSNLLPGLNKLIPNMPTKDVSVSLTLSDVSADGGDVATGYSVTVSSNGTVLYTFSGTDPHLLKKTWTSTTGEVIDKAAICLLMQAGDQATANTMSIASFSVAKK
jgi:hypothetical protein